MSQPFVTTNSQFVHYLHAPKPQRLLSSLALVQHSLVPACEQTRMERRIPCPRPEAHGPVDAEVHYTGAEFSATKRPTTELSVSTCPRAQDETEQKSPKEERSPASAEQTQENQNTSRRPKRSLSQTEAGQARCQEASEPASKRPSTASRSPLSELTDQETPSSSPSSVPELVTIKAAAPLSSELFLGVDAEDCFRMQLLRHRKQMVEVPASLLEMEAKEEERFNRELAAVRRRRGDNGSKK
eukprot:m51a1_g7936 hypothetical protein (242) ;mRNA; f:70471-71196